MMTVVKHIMALFKYLQPVSIAGSSRQNFFVPKVARKPYCVVCLVEEEEKSWRNACIKLSATKEKVQLRIYQPSYELIYSQTTSLLNARFNQKTMPQNLIYILTN